MSLQQLQELVDANKENIKENDYLQMCNLMKTLYLKGAKKYADEEEVDDEGDDEGDDESYDEDTDDEEDDNNTPKKYLRIIYEDDFQKTSKLGKKIIKELGNLPFNDMVIKFEQTEFYDYNEDLYKINKMICAHIINHLSKNTLKAIVCFKFESAENALEHMVSLEGISDECVRDVYNKHNETQKLRILAEHILYYDLFYYHEANLPADVVEIDTLYKSLKQLVKREE
jgi:hypothetical protein